MSDPQIQAAWLTGLFGLIGSIFTGMGGFWRGRKTLEKEMELDRIRCERWNATFKLALTGIISAIKAGHKPQEAVMEHVRHVESILLESERNNQ